MGSERFARTGNLMHRLPATIAAALTVAALTVTTLASAGPAQAGAHRNGRTAPRAATAPAGTISTVAGGVGGPARATRVAIGAGGMAFAGGQLYFADGSTVRKVSPLTDRLTTPVGIGVPGALGNRGPAAKASVNTGDVAADAAGNLVITDTDTIRVVAASTGTFYGQPMKEDHIYRIAGNGTPGFSGDGGPATSAELLNPAGISVDTTGNLVFADAGNNRIRVVAVQSGTFYGQAMTAGDIYTIAGGGTSLGDGGPATSAELFDPGGITVDPAGNVVLTTCCSTATVANRVRVVAVQSGTFYGQAMTAGDIYTIAGTGTQGFSGDHGPGTAARLHNPVGVAVDGAGNVLIADLGNRRIRVLAGHTGTFYGQAMTAGDIYTIAGNGQLKEAGDGGPATAASFFGPGAVAVDAAGDVLIGDSWHLRMVAAHAGTFYGQKMTTGDIYTIAGEHRSGEYSGDGAQATHAELALASTAGVAVDAAGNLLIADTFNNRIRVLAASTGTFYGRKMTARDIVAGTGSPFCSGDGGPATKARLMAPAGVAVDAAGNVLIADQRNQRVRVVAEETGTFYGRAMTAGDIYTVAGTGKAGFSGDGGPATSAEVDYPVGVAADGAGNLIISDVNNRRVRVVAGSTGTFYGQAMTAGDIYTVAGGGGSFGDGIPATSAELIAPESISVDSAGNLLIPDYYGEQIRIVAEKTGTFYGQAMTAGDIYTVAGTGTRGFSGDRGLATKAELDGPVDVVVDPAGNLLIADQNNQRIRVVAEETGTFYGRRMIAGDIYTAAGDGGGGASGGFSGDGGLATKAELSLPSGVAFAAGNLIICDDLNRRIRMVTG
jgi:hypothetical protein